MIGKLKGFVDSVSEDELILDVNGVGYVVAASARTLRHLPAVGEAATLHIETQVREDAIRLFGFLAESRARLVPPAAERAGRRRQSRAGDPGHSVVGRIVRARSPRRTRRWWRARRGSGPSSPRGIVLELKDKGAGAGALPNLAATSPRARPLPACRQGAQDAVARAGQSRLRAARRRRWRSRRASPRSAPTRRRRR